MVDLMDIRFSFLMRKTYQSSTGQHPIVLRIIFRGGAQGYFHRPLWS